MAGSLKPGLQWETVREHGRFSGGASADTVAGGFADVYRPCRLELSMAGKASIAKLTVERARLEWNSMDCQGDKSGSGLFAYPSPQ